MKNNFSKNKGSVLIIVMFLFITISLSVVLGLVIPIVSSSYVSRTNILSKRSYFTAESGIEDVVYRLKNSKQVSSSEALSLNGGTATTTVTDVLSGKEVISNGDISLNIRKLKVTVSLGKGASFHYGIQSGQGGFVLQNSSSVDGNVFSGGTVVGGNNYIYGDVVSSGAGGLIDGIHVTGSALAHTIKDSVIDKDAYYQTITGTFVGRTSYPNSPDQPVIDLPISDAQIEEWKADAEAGGVISSPCPYVINSNVTIGPKKINCDLEIKGVGTQVTLNGPIWVVGNIETKNTPTIKINSSFGKQSVPVIADNPSNRLTSSRIFLENNTVFKNSGTNGSFIFMISQNNSAESGGTTDAIVMTQGAGAMVAYASHGQITLANNVTLKEVTAYKIILQNTAQVKYDTGLPTVLFSAGPGGSYDILDWQETQ